MGSRLLSSRVLSVVSTTLGLLAFAPSAHAQQGSPPPAPGAQAPAATPPFPNRLNTALPAWLRVRGEFRGRAEGFEGLGFTEGRDDAYWLNRFRFNATITPSRQLSFQVQAQDARVAKKQLGPTGAPFKATFDLRMAFADLGAAKGPVTVRLGRQELAFGEQRLVGHVSWLNAARTFDAGRVTVRRKALQVDAFAASVVRIMDREFDKSGAGNRFFGAYATTSRVVPKASFEPYVFQKRDRSQRLEAGTFGDLTLTTFGARLAGQLPAGFDYGVESAVQTGSIGSDDVQTWAGHYQVRTPAGPRALRLLGEFNYASGDPNPTDGKRGTFDQLYPTPHDKFGLADQVGWRNIEDLHVAVDVTPRKGWPVSGGYHSWWLAQSKDGLYGAGGALVARIPAGAASRHVGQELDIQMTRAVTPQLQIAAGYAHIFPGAFLKQATPGASYSLPFAMATYVFLAER
jgi:hypothetical protein